ncbi:hypothetical protein EZBTHKR_2350 [Elizabethkingia anophelis]|nr:hypothetical protein EZBTHKR_2350 [Elizabethkingia anophelis]
MSKKNLQTFCIKWFTGIVPNTDQISNHFIEDLERISNAIDGLNND